MFPGRRVARVDRDTIRRRGAIVALLSRFAAGEIDVLVGTQMIAKGHDFPARHARRRHLRRRRPRPRRLPRRRADVSAADAGRRTRRARRDSRAKRSSRRCIPRHYSIRHACRQDYAAFFEDEIDFRRGMRYPPAVALINAVVKARTREAAMERRRRSSCRRCSPAASRTACSVRRRRRSSRLQGRAPRPVLHQGDAPPDDAPGAADGAGEPAGDPAADDRRRRSDDGVVEQSVSLSVSGL